MISITSRPLGVLVIKPAKGGAQLSVNAAGNPSQIKVRLDIARQGPPGADGSGSGTGDLSYTHNQNTASSVWAIAHGLGKKPSVMVQDSAHDEVAGDVFYNDLNSLTITFSAAFSGVAYLN